MIQAFIKMFKKSAMTPAEAAYRQMEIEAKFSVPNRRIDKLIEENRTKCLQLKTWL